MEYAEWIHLTFGHRVGHRGFEARRANWRFMDTMVSYRLGYQAWMEMTPKSSCVFRISGISAFFFANDDTILPTFSSGFSMTDVRTCEFLLLVDSSLASPR